MWGLQNSIPARVQTHERRAAADGARRQAAAASCCTQIARCPVATRPLTAASMRTARERRRRSVKDRMRFWVRVLAHFKRRDEKYVSAPASGTATRPDTRRRGPVPHAVNARGRPKSSSVAVPPNSDSYALLRGARSACACASSSAVVSGSRRSDSTTERTATWAALGSASDLLTICSSSASQSQLRSTDGSS